MQADTINPLWRGLRRRIKAVLLPTTLLALTVVFGWQATQGDHGLIMRTRRDGQLRQAEENLAAARLERDNWRVKVAGLTAAHLDRDALDQRARETLNLADPSEIVVQYPPRDKLF